MAEEKKKQLLEEVKSLRIEFESLKKYDGSLDPFFRLEFKDFNIDEEYHEMIKERVNEMLDEANKEVSWGIEYSILQTQKVSDFFLHELEINRLSVQGFKKPTLVTTFKVKAFCDYIKKNLEELDKIKISDEKTEEKRIGDEATNDKNDQDENGKLNPHSKLKKVEINQNYLKMKKEQLKDMQASSSKEKFTREKMKQEMAHRAKLRKELNEKKPDTRPTEENDEIKQARKNMGNYDLKSDDHYEVPNHERMNVSKQRKMIYMVEEFIHEVKMDFNRSLLEMKENKKKIFDKIIETNKRIEEINAELEIEETLFTPSYNEVVEFPEKNFEVTQEEIDELAKAKEEERLRKKQGRYGGQEVAPETVIQPEPKTEKKVRTEIQYKPRVSRKEQRSPMEEEMKRVRRVRLTTEKELLLTEQVNEVKE
jgi:hypothetical protein